MRVQCVICDRQSDLEDDTPLAKKLRNRPIHTFMCEACSQRIADNTHARHESGEFQLYRYKKKKR